MNDRREGKEEAPGGVFHIVADLETVDGKLARAAEGNAEIAEARALLRTVIGTLTRTSHAEPGEEAGTGKRRVKIKAESEIAAPAETARAVPPAKTGAAAQKTAARGARSNEGARSGRRPQRPEQASNGSLIARLGAAAIETVAPPASAEPDTVADAGKHGKSTVPLDDTAERLAQLEAEIDNLTEAVTASPARATAPMPQMTTAAATPDAKPDATPAVKTDEPGLGSDDEEDAEITIIGPDGAPAEAAVDAGRHSPRVFREGPQPFEEEAEVEIRGSGSASPRSRGAERPGAAVRVSTRTSGGTSKGGALAKWRIFRGS